MKKRRVSIIDYGMGNLYSVKKACDDAGLDGVITSEKNAVMASDAAILPGVGAFGDAMGNILRLDLAGAIRDFVASGRPFVGICLGMQLLMDESEEFGMHKGLGILRGRVKRIPSSRAGGKRVKVPQVGWNRIYPGDRWRPSAWAGSLLHGLNKGEFMYFVHSFYAIPDDEGDILSFSDYEGFRYCSSVKHENIFASQFHPEKSGALGKKVYDNLSRCLSENIKESRRED